MSYEVGNTATNETAERIGSLLEAALQADPADKANCDRLRSQFQQAVQQIRDSVNSPASVGTPNPGMPGTTSQVPNNPAAPQPTSAGVAPPVNQPTPATPASDIGSTPTQDPNYRP